MKKQYIAPTVECIGIEAECLLASSDMGASTIDLSEEEIGSDNKDDMLFLGRDGNGRESGNIWDSNW